MDWNDSEALRILRGFWDYVEDGHWNISEFAGLNSDRFGRSPAAIQKLVGGSVWGASSDVIAYSQSPVLLGGLHEIVYGGKYWTQLVRRQPLSVDLTVGWPAEVDDTSYPIEDRLSHLYQKLDWSTRLRRERAILTISIWRAAVGVDHHQATRGTPT